MSEKITKTGYLAVFIMAYGAWLSMTFGQNSSALLTSNGILALRYYTVDSNLLMGAAALLYVFTGSRKSTSIFVLTGTATVTLTFLTVMLFLGPIFGYGMMFQGRNLYMHLFVPLLAVALLILCKGCAGLRLRSVCWSALPTAAYSLFYIRNVMRNGPEMDWYSLAKGGPKTYPYVVLCFVGLTVLVAAVLWLASGGRKKAAELPVDSTDRK